MEKSYRVIWEIDVDAMDPRDAAQQAYDSITSGTAPVFEVHQWREPEMIQLDPVAMIDILDPEENLPVPDKRPINENYMGPDII